MVVLKVEDLSLGLPGPGGRTLVSGVSFVLEPGSTLGLAGQSGSGKTLTACALCGLLPPPLRVLAGQAWFQDRPLDLTHPRRLGCRRGTDLFLLMQSPSGSLDPSAKVGSQISEVLWAMRGWERGRARSQVAELLAQVGLEPDLAGSYPWQLSGGQRQRVLLAMAFALRPRVLLADEPTAGLDEANRDQVLALLKALGTQGGSAAIIISHDLRVLSGLAREMVILHEGRQVEAGPTSQVLRQPAHAHTQELVEAMHYLERSP